MLRSTEGRVSWSSNKLLERLNDSRNRNINIVKTIELRKKIMKSIIKKERLKIKYYNAEVQQCHLEGLHMHIGTSPDVLRFPVFGAHDVLRFPVFGAHDVLRFPVFGARDVLRFPVFGAHAIKLRIKKNICIKNDIIKWNIQKHTLHIKKNFIYSYSTQSRIIGAVRGAHSQLWGQLSLYVPHMLRVNMKGDLAHLQLSDLQEERILIRRT